MGNPGKDFTEGEGWETLRKDSKVSPTKRKSAADIEALRWREMFQAALTGFASRTFPNSKEASQVIASATQCADLGLREFYARYEREK
jgi:hypothetical protein